MEETIQDINVRKKPQYQLEALRQKHLEFCKLVHLHDEVYSLPIASYLLTAVAQSCLIIFILTKTSDISTLTGSLVQLLTSATSALAILWSGIHLNKEVIVIKICNHGWSLCFLYDCNYVSGNWLCRETAFPGPKLFGPNRNEHCKI